LIDIIYVSSYSQISPTGEVSVKNNPIRSFGLKNTSKIGRGWNP
jgi:hypothetical protein